MSEPGRHTDEQPVVEAPTVTTAPAHGGAFSRIPSHLGRARTSTVVLGVLFLAVFALYLNIRPATPGTTTTSESGTEQPAQTPATTSEPAPETTAEPTETSVPPTTSAPTTTPPSTDSPGPTGTTAPEETTEPSRTSPSGPVSPSAPSAPTGVTPSG